MTALRAAALLVLAALAAPVACAPKKQRAPAPSGAPTPTAGAPSPLVSTALSSTITPYHTDCGIPFDSPARYQACLDMQAALHADAVLRHADGQMDYFVCGLEFGTDCGNPHL